MILDLDLASDLFGFLDEFQNADLNDCVDFICEKHDIDATDELFALSKSKQIIRKAWGSWRLSCIRMSI